MKVRVVTHVIGLSPGQEAEIDLTPKVRQLLEAGFLQLLLPKDRG